jgi:hypothetical protein
LYPSAGKARYTVISTSTKPAERCTPAQEISVDHPLIAAECEKMRAVCAFLKETDSGAIMGSFGIHPADFFFTGVPRKCLQEERQVDKRAGKCDNHDRGQDRIQEFCDSSPSSDCLDYRMYQYNQCDHKQHEANDAG